MATRKSTLRETKADDRDQPAPEPQVITRGKGVVHASGTSKPAAMPTSTPSAGTPIANAATSSTPTASAPSASTTTAISQPPPSIAAKSPGRSARGNVRNERQFQKFREDIRSTAAQKGPSERLTRIMNAALQAYPGERNMWLAVAEAGVATWQRSREQKRRLAAGEPLSRVVATDMDHRVFALQPSDKWTLLIDETGKVFDPDTPEHALEHREVGRIVALAIPGSVTLPALPHQWHAADSSLDDIDTHMQSLLSQPVGVLGFTIHGVPAVVKGDRWIDGMLEAVHWLLRLLPIPETGTVDIDICVEQRFGPWKRGADLTPIVQEMQRDLAIRNADRFSRFDLRAHVIGKDGHPANGYVDAVAFTWGSPTPASADRLQRSGLLATCLLPDAAKVLRLAWDELRDGGSMQAGIWRDLVLRQQRTPDGVADHLLHLLGERCRRDAELWRTYLAETRQFMETKGINPRELSGLVAWLAEYQPPQQTVPARLQLVWRTAVVGAATHHGQLLLEQFDEVERLSDWLHDEFTAEVCELQLRRAVALTNAYRFADARALIQPWAEQPVAVPGLRHHGRVWSSLGQHAAFLGDYANAEVCFQKALASFSRLSSPTDVQAESTQTMTYRAIAAMDDPSAADATALALVEHALACSVTDAIEKFSSAGAGQAQWPLYLLMRWALTRGSADVHRQLLARRHDWQRGTEHPWQLIGLYRAILLQRATLLADARREVEATLAICLAADKGPTLRLIGCTIGAIAQRWKIPFPHGTQELGQLRTELPAAHDRLDKVAAALRKPSSIKNPLSFAAEILPFNFR